MIRSHFIAFLILAFNGYAFANQGPKTNPTPAPKAANVPPAGKSVKNPANNFSVYGDGQLTLFSGIIPTVGLGASYGINASNRVDFAYQAGQITIPSKMLESFANDYWQAEKAIISQQSWLLGMTHSFGKSAFVGFGYKQKRLQLDLDCVGASSDLLDFSATAIVWTQGLYTHIGHRFTFFDRVLLDLVWIGFDIPLTSKYQATAQNDFLRADVGDQILNQSSDLTNFVSALRHYPWPYIFQFNLTIALF